MENWEPFQLWLLIGAVGYVGYLVGRASVGGAKESREDRRQRQALDGAALFASLDGDVQMRIDDRIRNRKIIEAVKITREASGAGLREAKMAVDARRAAIGG